MNCPVHKPSEDGRCHEKKMAAKKSRNQRNKKSSRRALTRFLQNSSKEPKFYSVKPPIKISEFCQKYRSHKIPPG